MEIYLEKPFLPKILNKSPIDLTRILRVYSNGFDNSHCLVVVFHSSPRSFTDLCEFCSWQTEPRNGKRYELLPQLLDDVAPQWRNVRTVHEVMDGLSVSPLLYFYFHHAGFCSCLGGQFGQLGSLARVIPAVTTPIQHKSLSFLVHHGTFAGASNKQPSIGVIYLVLIMEKKKEDGREKIADRRRRSTTISLDRTRKRESAVSNFPFLPV